MSARAQQVRMALWLTHLYSAEADDIAYAYPRPDGWEFAYDELDAASKAMYAHAERLAGGPIADAVWQAAMEAFDAPGALP